MESEKQETPIQPKQDDSFLALIVLAFGIILAVGVLFYFWKNRRVSGKVAA
jgi:Mg2+ and Co2+ transporter CorA